MVLSVTCSECFREYQVNATLAGKQFKCKKCGAIVAIPKQDGSDALYSMRQEPPPKRVSNEDHDEEHEQADEEAEGEAPDDEGGDEPDQELQTSTRKYAISFHKNPTLRVWRCLLGMAVGAPIEIPFRKYKTIVAEEGDALGVWIKNVVVYFVLGLCTCGIFVFFLGLKGPNRRPSKVFFSAYQKPVITLDFPSSGAMLQFLAFLKKATGTKVEVRRAT